MGAETIIVVGGVAIAAGLIYEETRSLQPSPIAYGQTPLAGSTTGQATAAGGGAGTPVAGRAPRTAFAGSAARIAVAGGALNTTVPLTGGGTQSASPSGGTGGGFGAALGVPASMMGPGTNGNGDPADTQQKADLIQGYCQASYDSMSDDAKVAAAQELNSALGISPPLTGGESWQQIVDAVTIAGSKDAGTTVGSALGGPLGSVLGGLCGAYLGAKIDDFINDNWNDMQAYFSTKYAQYAGAVSGGLNSLQNTDWDSLLDDAEGFGSAVGSAVEGAVDDAGGAIKSIFGSVF